jgi:PhzF family phenazine biosynthesis protein
LVVRAFPLGVGINEDPASGAANAAIAAFLDETGALGALGDRFSVSQGREMGRDARLLLRIDAERQVWVGGSCRTLTQGSFHWR